MKQTPSKIFLRKPVLKFLIPALTVAAVIVVTVFSTSAFSVPTDRDNKMKQVNLLIRRMGDRLLLQSGDKESRVLPVKQKDNGTFLLRFENEFTFSHDSLITLARRLMPKAQFPSGYTVTVHDYKENEIVFGFTFNNKTEDIIACSGRKEPKGEYTIEFAFPDFAANNDASVVTTKTLQPKLSITRVALILSALIAALAIFFGARYFIKRSGVKPLPNSDDIVKDEPSIDLPKLGKFSFDLKGQRLLLENEIINLTDKECKVLDLLYQNFGELMARDTLMQKVWIDEGVITGRSLDMFISKLRKKISHDPDLKITNVHGKGYRLEGVES